jgi:hypothetical protein
LFAISNPLVITVKQKLYPVKCFCCTIIGMMKKYLWIPIALVIVAAVILVARYDKNYDTGSHGYDIKCVQSSDPSSTPASLSCAINPKQNADQGQASPPWWYKLVAWPEGITAWMLVLTLAAIVWQAWETRRAADATEDAVKASEVAYRIARDTSERELRAYLTVTNARLFLYEDGRIEPRLIISNSGQTPAYEFMGLQALSLDGPLAPSRRPSDDILLRYGTVGKDYWLTGEMRKVGTTKQQILDYIMSGEMRVILYGWYKYRDVFGHVQPLDFQLVVSQRGALSKGQDSENEWLVFFDDWEAIPEEYGQKGPSDPN